MELTNDTLADESGIPYLSNPDDIPVHSTPIKGDKIPLPSTKNMMKKLGKKQGQYEEYTDAESMTSIRHLDLPPKGKSLSMKGQGHNELVDDKYNINGVLDSDLQNNFRDRNLQDLSNVDNLRRSVQSHPVEKAFCHERSRSPVQGQRSAKMEAGSSVKRQVDIHLPSAKLETDQADIVATQFTQNTEINSAEVNQSEKKEYLPNANNNAFSSYSHRTNLAKSDNTGAETATDRERYRDVVAVKISGKRSDGTGTGHFRNSSVERNEARIKFSSRPLDSRLKVEYRDNRNSPERNGQAYRPKEGRELRISRDGAERRSTSSERRQFVTSGSRNVTDTSTSSNKTLSSSKQNTSLSELENTTLQKQRQEIQLLMTELKDRDRELSEMMTSHQQQLVAWQQDRDRLVTLERKCVQHEEELRQKATQLRNALSDVKALKSTETDNRRELEHFRSGIDRLTKENTKYKEEIEELKKSNEDFQGNLTTLTIKLGKLEAREEELTASLRLKEKDISSATTHMKELSERLQQLDLRCKECQDREKEALKEKQEWKQKCDNLMDEHQVVKVELESKRREVVRLAEENKSARQQLALIQKEAGMMERCKDELIDSMRVKQERTDTQLRNLRELYERQLREVASLQMQLDNSKELIYRQQNSIDEQQSSGSLQGRLSQASEYSMERSHGSQKPASRIRSPVHSSRFREPDMTGSHHQTQSSGYQSQLYENQTGNQNVAISAENNVINLTACQQSQKHSSLSGIDDKFENQTDYNSHRTYFSCDSKRDYFKEGKISARNAEKVPDKKEARLSKDLMDKELSSRKNSQESEKDCTSPKLKRKLEFDSPKRRDGYVIEEMRLEVYPDSQKPDSPKRTEICELSEVAVKTIERARSMLEDGFERIDLKQQVKMQTDCGASTETRRQPNGTSSPRHEHNVPSKNRVRLKIDEECEKDLNKENCDADLESELNVVTETENDGYFESNYAKKYTFENKLCSFLEDLDDIDDSIWDEKPVVSANMSAAESSPASKLRKLLIESQQMIQSLEKSAESPRQTRVPDRSQQQTKETTASPPHKPGQK